jgi:hypothetical protein
MLSYLSASNWSYSQNSIILRACMSMGEEVNEREREKELFQGSSYLLFGIYSSCLVFVGILFAFHILIHGLGIVQCSPRPLSGVCSL